MTYPRIRINSKIIRNNVENLVKLCGKEGISVAGSTKGFCAMPEIAQLYIDGGVKYLADSRVENLIKLKDLDIEKILLRLPMISNVDEVVDYAHISLNSEIDTIVALSEASRKKGKIHGIILMVDLGDLREGYFNKDDLFHAVERCMSLKGVSLLGLGTNLTCYGGLIPTPQILDLLVEIGEEIEERYSLKLKIFSAGNSSSLHLLSSYKNKRINNLRLGESLLFGREPAYGKYIDGTRDDAFILQVELIEIKNKPSVPEGEIGYDAFGKKPTFVDRGIRKRALAAIGKQDMDFDSLYPLDRDIIVIGGSSDHLILDITDSDITYKVGDIVEFKLSYLGLLRAMTSAYLVKEII